MSSAQYEAWPLRRRSDSKSAFSSTSSSDYLHELDRLARYVGVLPYAGELPYAGADPKRR